MNDGAELAPGSTILSVGDAPLDGLLVSVIVPHYNDLAGLSKCIAALRAQTLPAARFEVVVADNLSTCGLDAVAAVCCEYARVISAPVRGAGPARNAGAALARGQILAFTDADCMPAPTWLEAGVTALAGYGAVGGSITVTSEREDRRSAVEAYEAVFAFDNKRYVETQGYSVTANLLVWRALFERVGNFRADVSEDVEWCRRATAAGVQLGYAPDVVVAHPARRNWAQLVGKWRRLTRESYLLSVSQGRGKLYWFLRSWVILLSPLTHAFRVLRTRRLKSCRERFDAIIILFKLRAWRFVECLRILTRAPLLSSKP